MKGAFFLFLAGAVTVIGFPALAKGGKKNHSQGIKLIEAYSQKTVPGIPRAQAKTQLHFIVTWGEAKYPETFFWRGDNGWLTCSMMKAHKANDKGGKMQPGLAYSSEFVTADKIHRGDTLILTPIAGGKFPVPAEIPVDAKNTLFYKTAGSGWLLLPVKNIEHKPDILMP